MESTTPSSPEDFDFADGSLNGKPIKTRFTWTRITADALRWEQAFSSDTGATWETNWTMHFARRR